MAADGPLHHTASGAAALTDARAGVPPCSGVVYKASYRGDTVAVKEIDLGRSTAMQQAFVQGGPRLRAQLAAPAYPAL